MSRLQKRCIAASAIFHGLLLLLVLVGSAFIPAKPKDEVVSLDLVDLSAILVDEPNVATGGNPNAGVPPAQPAAPQPQPVQPQPAAPVEKTPAPRQEVKPEPKPEPVREAVKEPPVEKAREPEPKPEIHRPDPDSFKISERAIKTEKQQKKEPTFDFDKAQKRKIIPPTRSSNTENDARADRAERERAAAQAAAAARAGAIGQALNRIQSNAKGGIGEVGIPGPGGAAYASYGLYVRKAYQSAWIGPNTSRGDEPAVEVEVVIRRDGKVLSSRIVKRSGRADLDRSVQRALDRVKEIRAFPEGSTDEKRTFRINFNLTDNTLSIG